MRRLAVLWLLAIGCDDAPVAPPPPSNGGNAHANDTSPPPPSPPPPPALQKLTWAALSSFEFKQRQPLPKEITALDGKKIEIAGFLYPTRQTRDIKEFILMRDPGTCCYGPQAQYNHFISVRIVQGKGVNYSREPMLVVGTLKVGEKWDGDYLDWIYEMEATEHRKQ